MSELGEVLELLHLGGSGITTLSATMREWVDEERQRRAFERASQTHGRGFSFMYSGPAPPPPSEWESRTKITYQSPDRYRIEQETDTPGGRPKMLQVRDGTRTWTYLPDEGEAWSEDDSGGRTQFDEFLDPSWLAAAYHLTVTGRTAYEGHPAIGLTGHPRPIQRGGDFHRLGAEEIRAVIDAETGLPLELTSLFEGEPFSAQSLQNLVVGEPLDDSLFEFTPPPGVKVKDVKAQFPRSRRIRWLMRLQRPWIWRLRRKRVAWYGPARRRRRWRPF